MKNMILLYILILIGHRLCAMDSSRPRAASLDSPKNRKDVLSDFAQRKTQAFLSWSCDDDSDDEPPVPQMSTRYLPDVTDLDLRTYMRLREQLKESR